MLNLSENVIFNSAEFGCQNFLLRMQQKSVENEWVFNIFLKSVIFFVTWNCILRCLTLTSFLCFFASWIKNVFFMKITCSPKTLPVTSRNRQEQLGSADHWYVSQNGPNPANSILDENVQSISTTCKFIKRLTFESIVMREA